jgi:hypothetical protein
MEISALIIITIEKYQLKNINFLNLGELNPEDYCLKIVKELQMREINITAKEFLTEIKRYFQIHSKNEYILMDIVKHFVKLFN